MYTQEEYKSKVSDLISKVLRTKLKSHSLTSISDSINLSLSDTKISSHSYLKSFSTCQLFERRASQNTQKAGISMANFLQSYKFTVDTTYKSTKILGKKYKNKNNKINQILDLDFDAAPSSETDFERQLSEVMKLNLDKVKWDKTWSYSRMNKFIKFDNNPCPKKAKKKQFINQDAIPDRENDDAVNYQLNMHNENIYASSDTQRNDMFESQMKNENKVKPKVPDEPAPFFEGWDTESFANQSKYENEDNSPEKVSNKPSILVSETFKEFGLEDICNKIPENTKQNYDDLDDWVEGSIKHKDETPLAKILAKLPNYSYLIDLKI